MSLEFHAKELKGARVMATFNLPCKVYSQVGQRVCFSLKIFWLVEDTWHKHWYKFGWNHWRNEWVIKQTIVEAKCKTKQRINHKVCDENKEKNDCPSKIFLMTGLPKYNEDKHRFNRKDKLSTQNNGTICRVTS